MTDSQAPNPARSDYLWLVLSVLVALGYLFQLGGDHIPRNGDELVYAHIARLTAESGHWLPLVSSYDFMRNTKPPMLFWQAMVAGGWGEHWTLFNLRLPSVLYLWATAAIAGLLVWNIGRAAPDRANLGAAHLAGASRASSSPLALGAIAATMFLSFFSTYRYGRPYLTSAPETFWLFGIFAALACSPARLLSSKWAFPLLAGLALGIGSLYKSFAMVAPVGLALAFCYQTLKAKRALWQIARPGLLSDAFTVALVCGLGLLLFSLWFALDPQPSEVWREFVVGENAGKFKSSPGYWKGALSGSGGVAVILTGYFVNAGLLFPLAVGCSWTAGRSYRARRSSGEKISAAEKVMWLWLLALALVFMLPNQRSARYLIPAMPAVAVLIALYWDRMARIWFSLTLAFCILGALAMGSIGYGAVRATGDSGVFSPLFWLLLALTVLAAISGMVKKNLARPVTAGAGFAVLLALAWVTAPFNGELGHFRPATVALMQGQQVRVPNNFNGQFERYQFILKGAHVVAYDAPQPVDYANVDALLATSRYALVTRRLGEAPCSRCTIIDWRWDLRSRQDEKKEGAWAAIKTPETFWYAKEYLVER